LYETVLTTHFLLAKLVSMEERTVQIGDKVSMGHTVYTVVSAPREGIFKGKDDAGEEAILVEAQVVRLKPDSQARHV
jgi:hypothetical protein